MTCQLLCVDPKQAHEFWPHCFHMIQSAMKKGRLSDFEAVERSVASGASLLWLAWNGKKIKAATVTKVAELNGDRVCTIVACGGTDRSEWLHLLSGLETYAKQERCESIRIMGRRGWTKLLPDYRVQSVMLEKRI